MMSVAAMAAAATMYDTVADVAYDVGCTPNVARAALEHFGIASVAADGRIYMTREQSLVAGRALDNAWRAS